MKNNNTNIIDKFLSKYEEMNNSSNSSYRRVYTKPTKMKSICGFAFSLLLFIFLIRLFVFKLQYFIFLIVDLLVLAYYGLNLFTKNGFPLPSFIHINNEENESNPSVTTSTTNNEKTYRIDK